jgi:hypothetical protein
MTSCPWSAPILEITYRVVGISDRAELHAEAAQERVAAEQNDERSLLHVLHWLYYQRTCFLIGLMFPVLVYSQ